MGFDHPNCRGCLQVEGFFQCPWPAWSEGILLDLANGFSNESCRTRAMKSSRNFIDIFFTRGYHMQGNEYE